MYLDIVYISMNNKIYEPRNYKTTYNLGRREYLKRILIVFGDVTCSIHLHYTIWFQPAITCINDRIKHGFSQKKVAHPL
jgi:hypothetical protein